MNFDESMRQRIRFTSPRWGEVDLLLAMQSIVHSKSGEGVPH
jgi:hypothetical protein